MIISAPRCPPPYSHETTDDDDDFPGAGSDPVGGRRSTRVKLSKLRSHPLQGQFFDPLSAAELSALAQDMKENGLRVPIEILPDGTVIDGHQRVAAARSMRWTEIEVVVRHDLATASEATKTLAFLGANLRRRHLHPLERARLVKAIMETEKGRSLGGLRRDDMAELRRRICELMGMGPKNVERYLHVLAAPAVVQKLFQGELIKLDLAVKIGVMMGDRRRGKAIELAEELSGKSDRKEIARIVHRYVSPPGGRHRKAADAFAAFAKAISRGLCDLRDRVCEVPPAQVAASRGELSATRRLIDKLLQRASNRSSRRPALDTVTNG